MPKAKTPRNRVLAAAFLIQSVVIGMMFGYGVFFKVLEDELGWSRTLLSSASSLSILVMGVFAIVAGRLSDRFGPRWVLTATGITTGVGYFLMSSMTAPWQLLLNYGLLVGLGFATHDVVTLSTVASWYPRRRGLVTGIVKTGSGCGQILVPLLVTWLVATGGWRNAFAALGVMAGVLLIALAQGMHRQTVADSQNSNEAKDLNIIEDGLSFKQAANDRILWTFCAIQFCFIPSLMTIPLHIVAHAADLGMAQELAAIILSTLGAASILGRLMVGHLVDRFGARTILCSCLAALLTSLLMLRFLDAPFWLFPAALIYGVAHGGLFTAVSPSVAEYFGMKSHGAIFGTILFFGTLSGTAGPVIAGMLFDRFQTYDLAFTILAVLATTGVLLASSLPSTSNRRSRA
jgi:MFS family permease